VNDEDRKWIVPLVDRLSLQFPDHTREALTQTVHDCHGEFVGSRVRDFVPILVERKARERLKDPAPPAPAATPVIPSQRVEAERPVTQGAAS
jgi:hypothetical protein